MKPSTLLALLGGVSLGTATEMNKFSKRENKVTDPMLQLSTDPDFHYEILRLLAMAPYEGSDIGEVLIAAGKIKGGDFESYYNAFDYLAERLHERTKTIDSKKFPVSAKKALFKESSYYRSADFFLHGNWTDPRINALWKKQLSAFDEAMGLMPIPGRRVELKARNGNFTIPTIFFSSGMPGPRPTILLGNGYDGSQEEMYHMMGQAALERGINIITYEGPGQPTVRRNQNIGFIPEWEHVVSPVLDYAETLPQVDCDAIGILGYSFGGYLAPRAAAFDKRISAVFAIDGIYDFGQSITTNIPKELMEVFQSGNASYFDSIMHEVLASPETETATRWALQQGLWSFNMKSPFEFITAAQKYNLKGLTDKIQVPVFVAGTENDIYFPGQATSLAEHLGSRATNHTFTSKDGAEEHCSVGANELQNQIIFDWFEDVIAKKKAGSKQ